MSTASPKHLVKYQDWLIQSDRKKPGTAKEYARFLTRCVEHYSITINEQTVHTEDDVQRIIEHVSQIVDTRGRWANGTFNKCDVTRNLIFALRGYVRFVQAIFPDANIAPPVAEPVPVASDVPVDELPKRLRMGLG